MHPADPGMLNITANAKYRAWKLFEGTLLTEITRGSSFITEVMCQQSKFLVYVRDCTDNILQPRQHSTSTRNSRCWDPRINMLRISKCTFQVESGTFKFKVRSKHWDSLLPWRTNRTIRGSEVSKVKSLNYLEIQTGEGLCS